jgi:hypothetical protein
VWEINQHIADARGAAPTMDDMPPEDRPEVCNAVDRVAVLLLAG